MTARQRIELQISETRSAINELLSLEKRSEEQTQELAGLTSKMQQLEVELRAAIVAEPDQVETTVTEDREEAELRELMENVEIRNYFNAAANSGGVGGRERELNQALGVPEDGSVRFPLQLLAEPELEERATADTATSASGDLGVRAREWIDRVFLDSASRALGVTIESVPVGVDTYPVVTAGVTPETVDKGVRKGADAFSFDTFELKPKRLTARYQFAVEDAARIVGFEEAMRRDLSNAMQEEMDSQVIQGNTTPAIEGFEGASLAKANVGVSSTHTFDATDKPYGAVSALAALIDGRYSVMPSDISILLNVGFYQLFLSSPMNEAADSVTLLEMLRRQGYMIRSSAHVPATGGSADDDNFGFASKARGLSRAAVAALWPSVQLIRDPYSNAAEGQVNLTACMLWDFVFTRKANFVDLRTDV